MSRQVWAFLASTVAAVLTVAAVTQGALAWAAAWLVAAVAAFVAARTWNQRSPQPFPYLLRRLLLLPRPGHSPQQLKRILAPRSGEHLLEVGPGIGIHALPIAPSLAPDGLLAVADVQRAMLVDLAHRANEQAITNIASAQAEATQLPYGDRTFDGAYLIGVLGEIPDQDAGLRELRRVLKPHGRLIVGEVCVDPDFVSLGSLRAHASQAGFIFQRKLGFPFAYLARFQPA